MSDYGTPPPPPPPPPPPSGGFQTPGYGPTTSDATLATWIQRVGAYLVDYALAVPFLILQYVFAPKTVVTNVNGVIGTTQTGGSTPLALLMSLLAIAVWGYSRWYKGGMGQSLGKQAVGLTLISEKTGKPIGMGMAFVRDLAHIIDSAICLIGYLFPLWDAKRQTIADKIMATVVTSKA